MITRLNVASIYVLDKDEALDFYVNKLGLEKGTDVKQGDYRWLTVRVPGHKDVEISLEQPGPPLHDEATAAQLRELITKGALGGLVFLTDDVRGALRDAQGARRDRLHAGAHRPLLRHGHGPPRSVRQPDPDPRAQARRSGDGLTRNRTSQGELRCRQQAGNRDRQGLDRRRAGRDRRRAPASARGRRSSRRSRSGQPARQEIQAKIAEMPATTTGDGRADPRARPETPRPTSCRRTYYGMPAYAKDGKTICFFQPKSKFKVRYSTFGFQPDARIDDGELFGRSPSR